MSDNLLPTGVQFGRRSVLIGLCAAFTTGCMRSPPGTLDEYDWRNHFEDLRPAAMLVDISARRLAFWNADDSLYLEYPIGVPSSPELTRTGRTTVVRKRANPSWRPTPSMLARNPDLPRFVGPGPDNPLGQYALYLGWQYYAIHGTNDPATIGRPSTSGCIRLFAGHIERLFRQTPIGAQVRVIN